MNRSHSNWRHMAKIATLSAMTMLSTGVLTFSYSLWCGNWKNKGSVMSFYVNPNGADLPADTQERLIRDGGLQWDVQGGANFTVNYLGLTTRHAIMPSDGKCDQFFQPGSNGNALAITYCSGNVSSGADTEYLDAWGWKDGTNYDLQTVATHEIGHCDGLGHSAVGAAVMYASYHGVTRNLNADDKAGLQAIYGTGCNAPSVSNVSPTSGPIKGGTIVTINGSNFSGSATVEFEGVDAEVVQRTGSTQIKVKSPATCTENLLADVTVINTAGCDDTLADAYTYVANTVILTTDGDGQLQIGSGETFDLYGPSGKKTWIVVGPPGTFTKSGVTIDIGKPFSAVDKFIASCGKRSFTWTVAGSDGETLRVQGVVKTGSGSGAGAFTVSNYVDQIVVP